MALTYYFVVPEDALLKHGDDLQELGAYSTARDARNHLTSRGFMAQNSSLTRWRNQDDEELFLTERDFDPYEQRWVS